MRTFSHTVSLPTQSERSEEGDTSDANLYQLQMVLAVMKEQQQTTTTFRRLDIIIIVILFLIFLDSLLCEGSTWPCSPLSLGVQIILVDIHSGSLYAHMQAEHCMLI